MVTSIHRRAILFVSFVALIKRKHALTTPSRWTKTFTRSLDVTTNGKFNNVSPFTAYPEKSIKKSRLFVATDKSITDDPAVRSIEKQMEKYALKKERAEAKLSKMEEQLQTLQKKKQQYLDGMKLDTPAEKNFSETTARSALKAFMWRIIAGSVTFFTSLRFSGSLSHALTIVGSDFFSKALTMFIGERLMNKSNAGRKGGADDVSRSLVKALVWRVFAICNTLTMSYIVAKNFSMASKIAGSDAIFKTGLMFFYERAWAKVEWGKEYSVEFLI